MKYFAVFFITLFFVICVAAAPKEIIIVRHADKWNQKSPGPFLCPKGQLRAERLAIYYLSHFKQPDYIFASNPAVEKNHVVTHYSYRPLQTVMPLANQLALQNGNEFDIDTRFHSTQYKKLATHLLTKSKYQNKIVLIAWHHGSINKLSEELGVETDLPKWHSDDYDQVYVLQYDACGNLLNFSILKHQYPVNSNPSWADLSQYQ